MFDKSLVLILLDQIEEALWKVERRFSGIRTADDFVSSDDGIDRLDAVAMMFIAIGEDFKRIDKITRGELLKHYPEIHWQGVKGVRDVQAHDYFYIDNEEIFKICKDDLPPLMKVLTQMREEYWN